MRKLFTTIALCVISLAGTAQQAPDWQRTVDNCIACGEFARAEQVMKQLPRRERKAQAVRIDSLRTIMERIRTDFNLTPARGMELIRENMPQVTQAQVDHWKATRKLEVMTIDGQEWWFRKSVRNLWLLGNEFKQQNDAEKLATSATRRTYYLEAMHAPADSNNVRDWRRISVTFTLDVNADAVPAGETLRVWMPFPFQNLRQRNITLDGGNRPVLLSHGSQHHTAYMEGVAEPGRPTHFEYSFSYDVGERHYTEPDLLAMLEPYDTNSELYRRYTASDGRHMAITPAISAKAREIVGQETNPVRQVIMLCRWIGRNLPWAGAREYSTLDSIPQYVLLNGHGDCGQVALLYIAMARSLGIPARWESGWMLHPDEINYHDWAETYFEGVGWVPTDPSFCRSAVDTPLNDYYATGIDVYRLASNEGVGDTFFPAKTYIRSETVDCQAGEVEWRGGNLYYDKWKSHLNVNSVEKLNK